MCGEKFSSCRKPSSGQGSPPRVRGKGPEFVAVVLLAGITPAYAGKSAVKSLLCHRVGDHPRVCGEKHRLLRLEFDHWGSPPRMRGKGAHSIHQLRNRGITPAYAGKSSFIHSSLRYGRDHPRVCGEKHPLRGCCYSRQGSPPRMRGKVPAGATLPRLGGITPAYAGKSRRVPAKLAASRDHPRVCGEKKNNYVPFCMTTGSPPRMRGKD